jgi:hypothetical protein
MPQIRSFVTPHFCGLLTVRSHPVPLEIWTAGAEHDESARARLRTIVESLGYRAKEQWWGVAGSQEITHVELIGPGGQIEVEAETYVGLTVKGDTRVIAVIRKAMESGVGLSPNTSLERTRGR